MRSLAKFIIAVIVIIAVIAIIGRLFFFDMAARIRNVWNSLKSIALLRVPDYHPFIRIRLPKADAKIIYRAVPRNGQVAVCR